MILIDYSNLATVALTSELYKMPANTKLDMDYMRHLIVNIIRSYRFKYHSEFGEPVIACDDRDYWRKDVFPHYKASRKEAKEKSHIDWETLKLGMDTIRDELKEYFPYPVVLAPKAEGDDVIGVLAEWSASNDLYTDGMWEGFPKPTLIVSSDGDAIQNQRFEHIKQFSPNKKSFVTAGMPIGQFLNEHIAEGDKGDGVPNTLSVGNSFVDKIRQKSLTEERKAEFRKLGIGACRSEEERKFFERNKQLVDLSQIPEDIKLDIIATFLTEKQKCEFRGKRKLLNYFIKHKMPNMIDYLTDF